MTPHTICFDFPELDGDSWFAAKIGDTFGLTASLEQAARFDERTAHRVLENGYGPAVAAYGVVVEVPR